MKTREPLCEFQEPRKEMIRIARRAVKLGLQSGTGGNISMRWETFYMVKPSGRSLYSLKTPDILVLDGQGVTVGGQGAPTKELRFHLGIYRERPDVGGVVHYHAPYATAFAVRGIAIPLLTLQARRNFPEMPVVPEFEDGSHELADGVIEAFRNPAINLVLLQAHGLVAVGKTLEDAQSLAELAEESAKTALAVRMLDWR
ncbi:MAG TPA: class II aldolase/adducin family protein [Syntrophorhabdaceae bacterium]|jgi:L-fuculose-phosphate aldolase